MLPAGVEAELFHPMARTVVIAIFIRDGGVERESRLMARSRRVCEPLLDRALRTQAVVLALAVAAVVLSGVLATGHAPEHGVRPQPRRRRLCAQALRVPVGVMLVSLFAMVGSLNGRLVFTGIPFALTEGVPALWLQGISLSISAAVGFMTLCGVAVLNGVLMLAFMRQLREERRPLATAVIGGILSSTPYRPGAAPAVSAGTST